VGKKKKKASIVPQGKKIVDDGSPILVWAVKGLSLLNWERGGVPKKQKSAGRIESRKKRPGKKGNCENCYPDGGGLPARSSQNTEG